MNIFDKAREVINDTKDKIQETTSPVTAALHQAGFTTIIPSDQSGDISLTGSAASDTEADRAIAIAKAVAGVTSVTNALSINGVAQVSSGAKVLVDTLSSNLNIRNAPGMDADIIGKAAHNEIVTLINKETTEWWKIRTDDGEEGYAASQYLKNPTE